MLCPERLKLVSNYREASRVYAESVCKMTDLVSLGIDSEVDLLRRACRMAWDGTEQARLMLFRHEADHNCHHGDYHVSAAVAGSSKA
jgi:hypothetical protein